MKINDEIKELFKDHKAHYKDLGEVQILDWKKDNTIMESIRYVFDSSKLYISGDFGCSVYWLTWKGTPQSFKDINLGYFYEKIEAHEDEKYSFNETKAREDIKYNMEFLFEDYNDYKESCNEEIEDAKADLEELDKDSEEYKEELKSLQEFIEDQEDRIKEKYEELHISEKEELLNRVLNVVDEATSMSSWAYFLGESGVLDDLSEVDCEYWEWIYGVGKSIPERAELHLAGLILANEYLEQNKGVEK